MEGYIKLFRIPKYLHNYLFYLEIKVMDRFNRITYIIVLQRYVVVINKEISFISSL